MTADTVSNARQRGGISGTAHQKAVFITASVQSDISLTGKLNVQNLFFHKIVENAIEKYYLI